MRNIKRQLLVASLAVLGLAASGVSSFAGSCGYGGYRPHFYAPIYRPCYPVFAPCHAPFGVAPVAPAFVTPGAPLVNGVAPLVAPAVNVAPVGPGGPAAVVAPGGPAVVAPGNVPPGGPLPNGGPIPNGAAPVGPGGPAGPVGPGAPPAPLTGPVQANVAGAPIPNTPLVSNPVLPRVQ